MDYACNIQRAGTCPAVGLPYLMDSQASLATTSHPPYLTDISQREPRVINVNEKKVTYINTTLSKSSFAAIFGSFFHCFSAEKRLPLCCRHKGGLTWFKIRWGLYLSVPYICSGQKNPEHPPGGFTLLNLLREREFIKYESDLITM